MIPSQEAIKAINQNRGDAVVIATMTAARFWNVMSQRTELDLPLTGCMSKASSLGLGLAMARPDKRVIVLDGDGCLLMNLGSLITISNKGPANLVHIVFQDDAYTTTGGQPLPGVGKFDLAAMARDAGFRESYDFDDLEEFVSQLGQILSIQGPTFICLKVEHPRDLPAYPSGKTKKALRTVAETLGRDRVL